MQMFVVFKQDLCEQFIEQLGAQTSWRETVEIPYRGAALLVTLHILFSNHEYSLEKKKSV